MIHSARRGAALAIAMTMGGGSAALAASPASLFYERSVMVEADARCRLFAPEISAALDASRLQARGAVLRSGAPQGQIDGVAERARTAAWAAPCGGPDLTVAAARVRAAFAGYAKMTALDFPGDNALWRADRRPTAPVVDHKAVEGPRWRLSETGAWDGAGPAASTLGVPTLGLAADPARPIVAVPAPALRAAATAFLSLRDPEKAALPYVDPRRRALNERAPPPEVTRTFVAQNRGDAPASLLPRGRGQGVQFIFPAAAADALSRLDPREAVIVEFSLPGRPPLRALFEVGDFAAGRAFLALR